MKANKTESVLIVVDIQERLSPHIKGINEIISNAKKLIRACQIFGIPIIVTEQMKLGSTVKELRELMNIKPIEKTSFSCAGEKAFLEELEKIKRKRCIILGIEAHICICQTALDLISLGYEVHVVVDAIGSRKEIDKEVAIEKMLRAKVIPTTTEIVMYELLEDARAEEFKDILRIVKE